LNVVHSVQPNSCFQNNVIVFNFFDEIVHPTKNEPQLQGISYREREREGMRERGWWEGQ